MKIFEFPFLIEIGSVADLDFSSQGIPLSIQGTPSRQVLMWGDTRHSLPDAWKTAECPFVRALPDGRALTVDTSFTTSRGKNAWIINQRGGVEANFEIGSASVEIAGLWGMIAVAFHPISAKAHGHTIQPLQRTAIAFFDLNGKLIMGFNQEASKVGVSAENVRCMTALSRSQLLFVPERLTIHGKEVENPVVIFDCATRRPKVYSAPYPRAEAVTMQDDFIHLASPEGYEDQIITFDPETKISQHRGEFLGIFRGVEGGGFLSQLSAADYAVVIPEEPEALKKPIHIIGDSMNERPTETITFT